MLTDDVRLSIQVHYDGFVEAMRLLAALPGATAAECDALKARALEMGRQLVAAPAASSAVEIGETRSHGVAVGLGTAAIDETMQAWYAWYQSTPYVADQVVLRRALSARAAGEEWQPSRRVLILRS